MTTEEPIPTQETLDTRAEREAQVVDWAFHNLTSRGFTHHLAADEESARMTRLIIRRVVDYAMTGNHSQLDDGAEWTTCEKYLAKSAHHFMHAFMDSPVRINRWKKALAFQDLRDFNANMEPVALRGRSSNIYGSVPDKKINIALFGM